MRAIAELHTGLLLQGRYRLHSELGTGSSSRVYLAADVRLHRPVAVKILHPALSEDETFVRRFRLEARAAASLNHPNIVHVYDWGSDDEGFYVVLEYLAGGSLRDLLASRRTLAVAQAASIGMAIAQALAFAHERGIVHRDIKPANLLFDESGTPHLADFGLAKALSEASWTEPNGLVLGTVRYASPEQALGQHLDDRSDVYSLGLVLYEAVTGCTPFAGDSLHALLIARVGSELPRSPELGALASVVDAATRPERAERLSAAELATRLERVVHGLGTPDPIPLVIGPSVTDPPDDERAAAPEDLSEESTALDELTILDTGRRSDAGDARRFDGHQTWGGWPGRASRASSTAAPAATRAPRVDRRRTHPARGGRHYRDRALRGLHSRRPERRARSTCFCTKRSVRSRATTARRVTGFLVARAAGHDHEGVAAPGNPRARRGHRRRRGQPRSSDGLGSKSPRRLEKPRPSTG